VLRGQLGQDLAGQQPFRATVNRVQVVKSRDGVWRLEQDRNGGCRLYRNLNLVVCL
jgi:hypothetical protein